MLNKREYHAELAKYIDVLKERKDHTQDELDVIGRNIPIRVMKDPQTLARYCTEKGLSLTDSFIIIAWVVSQFPYLNDISVVSDITYDESVASYEHARTNTIILHRVNYILHECMLLVYDVIEKDKKMRFGVKKAYGEAEKQWNEYLSSRRKIIERTAYYTMMDHLRLAHDAVSPFFEKVYESIRDYMISLKMRDVELKARIVVVFLMAKVAGHSFKHFFEDFKDGTGVDYTLCFTDLKMDVMVSRFDNMCSALGIKTRNDNHGFLMLDGFVPDKNQRFLWAWNDFIKALRDDDLMDETAQHAINLNPEVQSEYKHILEEENKKNMDEGIERLSEKYKVGSL